MDMRMPDDPATPPVEDQPSAVAPVSKPVVRVRKRPMPLRLPEKSALVETAKRQQSAIAFPYMDLDTAISVAKVMFENGGLVFTRDQLAGALKQSPSSGNFILKTSAARLFGLIEMNQGKFQLTQLGFAIVSRDEAAEKRARVDAFLNVPLYRRAYDEFKGRPLPPRAGLEHAFVQFGVVPKQKDALRQIFEKSARQAGFFNVDSERLIEPIIGASSGGERQQQETGMDLGTRANANARQSSPSADLALDELVLGLLGRLPKSGESWTPEQKAKWLRALSQNLDFIYELEGDKLVVVDVKGASEG